MIICSKIVVLYLVVLIERDRNLHPFRSFFFILYIYKNHIYISVVEINMIWRTVTPIDEPDCETQDRISYKWSDCVQRVSLIIFACHNNVTRNGYINDPHDTAYSTKNDE